MTSADLSPLAAALARTVATSRTTRVPVEALRQAALAADLSLAGAPDARHRLLEAITELAAADLVTLPRSATGWEEHPRPALPRWAARPAAAKPAAAPEAPVAWHAALSWVPAFLANERPSAAEHALLRAVNAFLGAGGSPYVVPLRERSLQLTGDEKALDSLSRGRLFAPVPRRLSLSLLRAIRVSPPLIRTSVGEGPVTLIVENYATYHSLAATLPTDGEVGAVAYGAGNTLSSVLSALADDPPAQLTYFGDLDVRGLEIAAAGATLAADIGLPPLQPAETLYEMLVTHGTPAPTGTRPAAGKVHTAIAWLPTRLRDDVGRLLLSGNRLAQEAVGLELLSTVTLRRV